MVLWQHTAARAQREARSVAEAARKHLRAIEHTHKHVAVVFLGAPGVGKGTYASLAARLLGLRHVVMGDILRRHAPEAAWTGELLPDEDVTRLLHADLEREARSVVLDGFPRTLRRAKLLNTPPFDVAVPVAVLLTLDETALVAKCLGRRVCQACGKSCNVADVRLDDSAGMPRVELPALAPPQRCSASDDTSASTTPATPHARLYPDAEAGSAASFLQRFDTTCDLHARADDTDEAVIRRRLAIFEAQGQPVQEYYREQGALTQFDITHGIPETTLPLMSTISEALGAASQRVLAGATSRL